MPATPSTDAKSDGAAQWSVLGWATFVAAVAAAAAAAAAAAYSAAASSAAQDAEQAARATLLKVDPPPLKPLMFATVIGTAPINITTHPTSPEGWAYYDVAITPSNTAALSVFRVESSDRDSYTATPTAEFLGKYLQGYRRHGLVFNPDSIEDGGDVTTAEPAAITIFNYRADGLTVLYPSHFFAISELPPPGGYMLTLRTYSAGTAGHYEPHRAPHPKFDREKPHFHTWPLSEKDIDAGPSDYPAPGSSIELGAWGAEIYCE